MTTAVETPNELEKFMGPGLPHLADYIEAVDEGGRPDPDNKVLKIVGRQALVMILQFINRPVVKKERRECYSRVREGLILRTTPPDLLLPLVVEIDDVLIDQDTFKVNGNRVEFVEPGLEPFVLGLSSDFLTTGKTVQVTYTGGWTDITGSFELLAAWLDQALAGWNRRKVLGLGTVRGTRGDTQVSGDSSVGASDSGGLLGTTKVSLNQFRYMGEAFECPSV